MCIRSRHSIERIIRGPFLTVYAVVDVVEILDVRKARHAVRLHADFEAMEKLPGFSGRGDFLGGGAVV